MSVNSRSLKVVGPRASPAAAAPDVAEHQPVGLAVLCDLREEHWPSMDLVAAQLLQNLGAPHVAKFRAERVCPSMKTRLGRVPVLGRSRLGLNADRLLNRMWDYPVYVRSIVRDFELFHVCDHSYSQLVLEVPRDRCGVFCHDLDTFRCLLEPEKERRPAWFIAIARRVLRGMEQAAIVLYSTSTVRKQIERFGLVDARRLVHAPYGISDEFSAVRDMARGRADIPPSVADGAPFLLHVGSCIPRKRIDVLLDTFAIVRRERPELRLVQVGGEWSREQRAQLQRHGLDHAVMQLPRMQQSTIATLYRRAALVLMPSESEGFGLPVVEALACGSIVVASDIPVFREVGADAIVYCPMGDANAWAQAVEGVLADSIAVPELGRRLDWSSQFSWARQARVIAGAYESLLA